MVQNDKMNHLTILDIATCSNDLNFSEIRPIYIIPNGKDVRSNIQMRKIIIHVHVHPPYFNSELPLHEIILAIMVSCFLWYQSCVAF